MYTSLAEFEKSYQQEAESTAKILGALTDASLSQAVADDHRTIGRIAWHIVYTIPEMMSQTGLKLAVIAKETPVPATAAEIVAAYGKQSSELLKLIKANWNDESLQIEDNLYGEQWKRGSTLNVLIKHEVHHRGQLTILMRQAGLNVPGVYGPSKEEWVNYGAEPPVI